MPVSRQKGDEPFGGALRQEGMGARPHPVPPAPQGPPLPEVDSSLDQPVDKILGQCGIGPECASQGEVATHPVPLKFLFGDLAQHLGGSCGIVLGGDLKP